MSVLFCNNNSMSAITSTPSGVGGGSMALISTQNASSSSAISFTSGLDSTYKEYIFKFINIHPATNDVTLQMNMSTDSGSNYNVTKTTTFFHAYHAEDASEAGFQYDANMDLAQSTNFQNISQGTSNANDMGISGTLHLFDPSNTTFVKHFISRMSHEIHGYSRDVHSAGYFNTTSALNAIQFKMSSGNMDTGTIKLYGVS